MAKLNVTIREDGVRLHHNATTGLPGSSTDIPTTDQIIEGPGASQALINANKETRIETLEGLAIKTLFNGEHNWQTDGDSIPSTLIPSTANFVYIGIKQQNNDFSPIFRYKFIDGANLAASFIRDSTGGFNGEMQQTIQLSETIDATIVSAFYAEGASALSAGDTLLPRSVLQAFKSGAWETSSPAQDSRCRVYFIGWSE